MESVTGAAKSACDAILGWFDNGGFCQFLASEPEPQAVAAVLGNFFGPIDAGWYPIITL